MLSQLFTFEFVPWELGMEDVRFFKLKLHQPMHPELPNMLYLMLNRNTYKARKDGSTRKVYDASRFCGHQLQHVLGVALQSTFHTLMWRGWKASNYIVDAPLQVGSGVQLISAIWCACVEPGRWKWDGSSLSEASAGLPGQKGRNLSAAHSSVYPSAFCVSSNSHGIGDPLASLLIPDHSFGSPHAVSWDARAAWAVMVASVVDEHWSSGGSEASLRTSPLLFQKSFQGIQPRICTCSLPGDFIST